MQRVDLVIKNCKLVIPRSGVVSAGVAVDKGKVVAIASDANLPEATKEIDAKGNYVFPGAIDTHTHYGVPGILCYKNAWGRQWRTESQSSAIGGVTTVVNLSRGTYLEKIADHESFMGVFEEYKDLAARNSVVDFRIATALFSDQQISEAPTYAKKFGVSNFKMYRYRQVQAGLSGRPSLSELYIALEKIRDIGYPALIHLHCENMELIDMLQERLKKEGRTDPQAWNDSGPPITEAESTASALMLAEELKSRLLIIHMTCAGAVEALVRAKQTNTEVYGETCPQYLTFTKDDNEIVYPGISRSLLGKVRPPIRGREHVERLWEAIAKGEIDVIGSDHVLYYHLTDKSNPGTSVWSFLPGFTSSTFCLPVLLSAGINKRGLSFERVAEVTSYNAARIMGMYPQKGTIAVGSDADFAIVDMNKKVVVKPEMLKSDSDFTLWDGLKFKGWPVMTILRGNVIVDNGEIVGKPGTGKYLRTNY